MSDTAKSIEDLLEIIHFTGRVATKIRGIPDEEKLVTIATQEFAKSTKYDIVIFFLTGERKLRIAGTDIDPKIIRAGEKAGKRNMRDFRVSVKDTHYLKQVIQEKRTVKIPASELAHELFPPAVAKIFITAIGYEKDLIILTPLKRRDKVIGVLTTISSQLTDEFIPSVENLGQNISNALERSEEYLKLKEAREQIEKAQAQLQKSLQEKELLLKEIHHRVNTNMQVVSALLSLQSRFIRDPQIREIFKQGQSRIRALALIHEKLYQSGDLTCLDFSMYIRDLAIYLYQTYKVNPQLIQLNIQTEEILLDINTAIPCGLILNELIANALKHAFPGKKQAAADHPRGELRIRFTQDAEKTFTMVVSDNGIGLPAEIDFQDTESLGLQLVNMLAYQLKSSVEIKREPGTTFRFTFQEKIDELYVY